MGAEFFDGDGGGEAKVVWRCEEDTGEASGLAAEDRARLRFTETEDEMYFFGIIDILTEYKAKKKVEHFCTGPLARGRVVAGVRADAERADRLPSMC